MSQKPLFWLLDDEWDDHSLEIELLRRGAPECEVRLTRREMERDFDAFGKDADVVLAQIDFPITEQILRQMKRCRGVAVFGSGYDNVDVSAAKRLGIPVTNVNGYCVEDIADYVVAAILRHNKRLDDYAGRIALGEWGGGAIHEPIHRLSGQSLLLAGFGRIGSVTARKSAAMGLHMMVYDPFLSAERVRAQDCEPVALEEGLERADFVSIHMPLTKQTKGIFNRALFERMKSTAVFINAARGALVNEEDLASALAEGEIAGAVLDVLTHEPPPPDHPLLHLSNCLVTPHISYASEESTRELRRRTVENALSMYRREQPADLVRELLP